jgi:hypothetical protein
MTVAVPFLLTGVRTALSPNEGLKVLFNHESPRRSLVRTALSPNEGLKGEYPLQWHFSKGRRKPAHLDAQKTSGYVR